MHKKLIMACMAIAAFAAFVVAPAASGASLTEPTAGQPDDVLAPGTSITATAGETKFTAGGTTVVCTHAHMAGTLTANAGGTIAGTIPAGGATFGGTGANTDCTSGLGDIKPTLISEICLHVAKGTDVGTATGCEGKAITFALDVTGLTTCNYEKSSLNVEITTGAANDAKIRVVPGQLIPKEGGFFCPNEGELDMEFTLTTTGGATLYFS